MAGIGSELRVLFGQPLRGTYRNPRHLLDILEVVEGEVVAGPFPPLPGVTANSSLVLIAIHVGLKPYLW